MPKHSAFELWLKEHGLPADSIEALIKYAGKAYVFETPARIMTPDIWFHFPGNTRFVLVGSCPNGDAIAVDTKDEPGAVYFIDHERVHENISDRERTVRVAASVPEYLQCCRDDPEFPFDYHGAKYGG